MKSKDKRMCDIKLHYRRALLSENFLKLIHLRDFLQNLNIEALIEEEQYYGPCWSLYCFACVNLSIAEKVYQYCIDHNFAVSFLYRPSDRYYLTNN